MRKTFILRLTKLFTVMAAVVGIALHPASKLANTTIGGYTLGSDGKML